MSYFAIGCLGLFAACSGPASTAPTPTPSAPSSVTLTLDGAVYDTAPRVSVDPGTDAVVDIEIKQK